MSTQQIVPVSSLPSAVDEAVPFGSPAPPFPGVRRIAVLRGGGIGDTLFAEPALRALAHAYPEAEIALLGGPVAPALFHGSIPPHAVRVLPHGWDRAGGPASPAVRRFLDRAADPPLDLAVQLHGGGRQSNPVLAALGARHTVGAATSDSERLERTLPYVYYQHEVLRALEVVALAGAAPVGIQPSLRLPAATVARERARRRDGRRLLVIHPGASDPRRRWPAERFGEIAARAAAEGWRVVVVGSAEDVPAQRALLGRALERGADPALVSGVAGRVELPELMGLLAVADVVLGNDSGPRHLAEALGAATVGVYWIGNVVNAGPLARGRHRVLMGWATECPVCGADLRQVGWTAPRCPHDGPLLTDVSVEAVWREVAELMATTPPPRGR